MAHSLTHPLYAKWHIRPHDEMACWIKQKETIENPQLLDKDGLSQTLFPDDIILGEENRLFTCKETGDGDYLLTLHHVSWLATSLCAIFFVC